MRNPGRTFWLLMGAVAAVYLLAFLWIPQGGFFVNDNGCKFIQARALIENDYQSAAIPWSGVRLDPRYEFSPLPNPFGVMHEGRLYGVFSPPFVFVSSLGYRLAGYTGLHLFPLLCGLLLLAAVWFIADQLPGATAGRPLAVLVGAFCTPVWFYSLAFWEHVPSVALIGWSLVFFLRFHRQARIFDLVASAVFVALAAYFRDEVLLFAACLVLFLLARPFRPAAAVWFTLTVAAVMAPLSLHYWSQYGHPLGLHLASATREHGIFDAYLSGRLQTFRHLFVDAFPELGLSLLVSVPCLVLWIWRPRVAREAAPRVRAAMCGFAILAGVAVLAGHLGSDTPMWRLLQTGGFFGVAPVLVLGLILPAGDGVPAVLARRLALLALVYALVHALVSPATVTTGIHWPGRFLFPLYLPFAALAGSALGTLWTEERGRRIRGLAIGALVVSMMVQTYSLTLLERRKSFTAEVSAQIAARGQSVLVAEGWFVPQELAPVFYDKTVYLVQEKRLLRPVLDRLRAAGADEILVVSSGSLADLPLSARRRVDDGLGFVALEIGVYGSTRRAP